MKLLISLKMPRRIRIKSMNVSWRAILLLAGCGIGLMSGCSDNGSLATPGKPAQDFRLETLAHDRFYLNQQQGKVTALVFWATWCSSCKQELVALQSLAGQLPPEKLVIAAICTNPENLDTLKAIVQNLGLTYPVLLDQGAKVFQQYHLRAYPTTIIIDQAGIINVVRVGYSPVFMKQIKTTVESLLNAN